MAPSFPARHVRLGSALAAVVVMFGRSFVNLPQAGRSDSSLVQRHVDVPGVRLRGLVKKSPGPPKYHLPIGGPNITKTETW
eukprot:g4010.t1